MDHLLIALAAAFVIGSGLITIVEQRRTDIEWGTVTGDATFSLPDAAYRAVRPDFNRVSGVVVRTTSDRLTYLPGRYAKGSRLCIELNEGEVSEFRTATVVADEKCT